MNNNYEEFLGELSVITSPKFIEYLRESVGNKYKLIKYEYKKKNRWCGTRVYIMTDGYCYSFIYISDHVDGYGLNKMSNKHIEVFSQWMKESFIQ